MTQLFLYDTRSKSKRPFQPLGTGPAGVYSCGPTVYGRQHIGNLRAYVFADLLKRTLRWFGHEVRHVINITDVGHLTSDADQGDDKVERAAREAALPALQITERFTELFQRDLARLGVQPPEIWAKATEHMAEQIEMIRLLEDKGFTYRLPDGIYFDTGRDPNYGELASRQLSAEHTRLELGADKRNPADFALWKLSPQDGPARQLEWPSPWGTGFPGWHIECSAMATKHLGKQFEIHTGGVDHIPVHHTNEIAQAENALGVRPWVGYWMHGGWLMLDGEKLSKSRGRPLNLDDLAESGIRPAAYRYYLLTAHYQKPLAFNWEALRAAQTALERLSAFVSQGPEAEPATLNDPVAAQLRAKFRAALGDDLNAPQAIATLWDIARETSLPEAMRAALVRELGQVLGLELPELAPDRAPDPELSELIRERELARSRKDFARADALRARLAALGVEIEDAPSGPRARRR